MKCLSAITATLGLALVGLCCWLTWTLLEQGAPCSSVTLSFGVTIGVVVILVRELFYGKRDSPSPPPRGLSEEEGDGGMK